MKEKYDHIELYCPKLGHHLTFKYCRTENLDLPCSRIIKCCSDRIPIQSYIYNHFSSKEVKEIFKGPATKMNSILRIVQEVNKEEN